MIQTFNQLIKKELKSKEHIFGAKVTLKLLNANTKVEKIYLAKDCGEKINNDLERFKDKVEIIHLDFSKEEMKDLCKKPFNISVLTILGEKTDKQKAPLSEEKVQGKEKKRKKKSSETKRNG